MKNEQSKQYLTVRELEALTRHSEGSIRRKLCKHEWPYVKIAGKTLVPVDFINKLLADGYHPATITK